MMAKQSSTRQKPTMRQHGARSGEVRRGIVAREVAKSQKMAHDCPPDHHSLLPHHQIANSHAKW